MLNSFCCIFRLDRLAREALNMDLPTAYAVHMTSRGSVANSNAGDNLWGWCDRLFAGLNLDDNRVFPRTDQVSKQQVEPNRPNKWHWLLMIRCSLPLLGQVGDHPNLQTLLQSEQSTDSKRHLTHRLRKVGCCSRETKHLRVFAGLQRQLGAPGRAFRGRLPEVNCPHVYVRFIHVESGTAASEQVICC